MIRHFCVCEGKEICDLTIITNVLQQELRTAQQTFRRSRRYGETTDNSWTGRGGIWVPNQILKIQVSGKLRVGTVNFGLKISDCDVYAFEYPGTRRNFTFDICTNQTWNSRQSLGHITKQKIINQKCVLCFQQCIKVKLHRKSISRGCFRMNIPDQCPRHNKRYFALTM